MKKIGYIIIVIILSIVCISYFFSFNNSLKDEKKISYVMKEEKADSKFNEFDEYILSVVACEMPASYNEEALKAQAIAARTFAVYRLKVDKAKKLSNSDQCTIDEDAMKNKWKDNFNLYYNKLKKAVIDTKDEIVLKDAEILKTFFFSSSNGYTESSKTVFNKESSESVASLWDKESKDYKKSVTFTKEELVAKLGDFKTIKINERNKTNHVTNVLIDDKLITGTKFRSLLNLRSTDFTIEIKDNNYIFTTYGYGHGVGMSQYGANYLAKNGKNSHQILKYYYGNIDIQKINV